MHSLCFSGVHCIICDVRFQMEKNIQASETAVGASLAVDLPECSFFIISYFLFFVRPCESSFLGSVFVDLETVRSAMACTRRRIRRREMAECLLLIGMG